MLQILISGTTKECGKLFPLGLWKRLQSYVLMAQTHSLLPQDHLHGFIASWWKNEHPWVSSPGLSPIRGDDLTIDQDALVLLSFPLLKALRTPYRGQLSFLVVLDWLAWHTLWTQQQCLQCRIETASGAIKITQLMPTPGIPSFTFTQHSWKVNQLRHFRLETASAAYANTGVSQFHFHVQHSWKVN